MSSDTIDQQQMNGTDSFVPPSSPRTVEVENVVVTPRNRMIQSEEAQIAQIDLASAQAEELSKLNAQSSSNTQLTSAEQDSVQHALYAANTPAQQSQAASSPSAAAATPSTSTALFTPSSSVTRICLSVRANDLLSPAWFSEATSLLALFAIDTTAAGSNANKYQLLNQTEFIKDSNAPVFKTQFVLDRSGGKQKKQNYMLRVYDVESEVIDEAGYLGLAIFNLEEILQNCRSTPNGGGFVSVVLPLINPVNATWNEQLQAAHTTVTLSLQIPVEAGTPIPAVSQSTHQYTRLINFLAPNILATNMDLTLSTVDTSKVNLLSVWYRTRSTALFQFMGTVSSNGGSQHTLVISNELFLEESSDASSQDEVEAGFEVRVLAHDRSKLPATALATAKGTERLLGASVNRNTTDDNASTAANNVVLGSATTTFKNLMLALDQPEGLSLPLVGDSAGAGTVKLQLKTRPAIVGDESNGKDEEEEKTASSTSTTNTLTIPSLPASIPSSVLSKAHELLKQGLYFTQYLSEKDAQQSNNGQDRRNIFIQLIDGVSEGKNQPTRLTWRASDGNGSDESSIPLNEIQHLYGGQESSEIFRDQLSRGKSLPGNDTLFTLTTPSQSLSLEASSWQTRDTFIFSILSYQVQCGFKEVALWHPTGVEVGVKPKIVAQETPSAGVQSSGVHTVKPQLGGSHGSLARSSPAPKTAAGAPAAGASTSATPAASSASSSNNDVDLSEVLTKLEKLFEQGRNFIRFTSGGHKPYYISLFLRKERSSTSTGSKPLFSLYWCRADQRLISSTRSIRCDEITGIALGKQTSVFKKEEASLAPSSHCFSIISEKKSLHLQSWNERDSDTYSFGIASLIKQYNTLTKPKLWQAGQYQESLSRLEVENASELTEEPDGTVQVDPSDIPTLANAQGYKCSIELSIKCKNLPSKHNNHIVCVFDRDEQTEKLTYLAQTEKQTRGVNPEFRKVFRLTYDSTVLRKLRFNVYDLDVKSKQMDDEDRMGSAMMLLKEVVDGAGIEYVYKLTHENPAKQSALAKNGATIVISCSSKSEMALDVGAGAGRPSSTSVAHDAGTSESVRKSQSLLLSGDVFSFHYSSRDPQQRFLFYTIGPQADSKNLGTLWWCEVGSRSQEPAASLPLQDIRTVILGKRLDPFETNTPSGHCFSVIAEDQQRIDVECRTTKQRDDFARAIIGILKSANQNVRVEEIA